MKFEEVVPALRDGKGVRRTCWLMPEEFRLDCRGAITTHFDILADDWEVVEAKPKPTEDWPGQVKGISAMAGDNYENDLCY